MGEFEDLWDSASGDVYEHFAQSVADAAREDGLTSADSVVIDAQPGIDIDRVRRRANEILASG